MQLSKHLEPNVVSCPDCHRGQVFLTEVFGLEKSPGSGDGDVGHAFPPLPSSCFSLLVCHDP